jgi:protein-S-isoprenylcysteine O-methyltransferase Ste14
VVSVPFPEGEGNTCTLQPSTDARDDRFAIRSLSLVVLFTPLFILANVWELKEIEEPELVKRLGEDYVTYQQRTPMFMPRMRPKK